MNRFAFGTLSFLFSVTCFARTASPYSSDFSRSLMKGSQPNAWTMPKWGFVRQGVPQTSVAPTPKSLSRSLVFDRVTPTPTVHLPSVPLVPAKKPVAAKPTPREDVPRGTPRFTHEEVRVPELRGSGARVLVLDEEGLSIGEPKPLAGAEVHWISANSGLHRTTGTDGIADGPYAHTISTRFIVTLPGYLPAVGYATAGYTTPVVLYHESRLGPVLKTLGIVPDSQRTWVIGKLLDDKMIPQSDFVLDSSVEEPFRTYYSLGSFGLFHAAANATGFQGDFVISGLREGLQYLMPSSNKEEWPAWIVDFNSLPPVVSVTLSPADGVSAQTQIMDAMALEPIESGVHVTIGGTRGLFIPDDDGYVVFESIRKRGSSDLIEVKGEGYLKTWLSVIPGDKFFPPNVSLFRDRDLYTLFNSVSDAEFGQGVAMGNLSSERFAKSVVVSVYGADGRRNATAKVHYFGTDNRIQPNLTHTVAGTQNFAITGLPVGESHLVVTDAHTGKGLAIQAVRAERGTISQIQF